MYGEVILDHARHPRNYGAIENPDLRHEDLNPLCGDRVRIELSLSAGGIVRAVGFQGDLCVIAKAASSILTEMIKGSTLDAADDLPRERLLDALHEEIRPSRLQCVFLPLDVLRAAIGAYRSTQCISREP